MQTAINIIWILLSIIINFTGKMLKIYTNNNKCQLLLILRLRC